MIDWDGAHVDRVYRGPSNVRLHPCSSGFEVLRSWNGERFEGWYINLVDPWARTNFGFDTWDRVLDIEVAPDLSSWRWKDEDEFEWALERGYVTDADAGQIRSEGLRAIDLIERRAFPFNDDWSDFRPDPSWTVPTLPSKWDLL